MTSMQITDSPSLHASAILTPRARSLRLRVGHPDGRSENVFLESAKITIGSAEGCNLRMDSPGLRPVHCMILRGPTGTVVRGWQGSVTVNGANVEACQVDCGDKLQLGALTITVLDEPEPVARPQKRKLPRRKSLLRRPRPSTRMRALERIRLRLRRRLRESKAAQRALQKKWRSEKRQWLSRFRGEEARFAELEQKTRSWQQTLELQQATLRQELQVLQARQNELPNSAPANTKAEVERLEQLHRELAEARDAWELEKNTFSETQRARRRLRLNRLRRATLSLRRQLQDLAGQSQALHAEKIAWESAKSEYAARQSQESTTLADQRLAIEHETARLHAMEQDLRQRGEELELNLRECAEQRDLLEQERSQFMTESVANDARIRSEITSHETAYAILLEHVCELERELTLLKSSPLQQASADYSDEPALSHQIRGDVQEPMESTSTEVDRRIAELEAQLTDSQRHIAELEGTIAHLTHDVETGSQHLHEINRLSTQVNQLLAQLADAEQRHSQVVQEQMMHWEQERNQWSADRADLEARWKAREQELWAEQEALQRTAELWQQQLAVAQAEVSQLQSTLLQYQNDAIPPSDEVQDSMRAVQESLLREQSRCEELQNHLNAALAELEHRSAQLQEAMTIIEQTAATHPEELQGEFAAQLDALDQQMTAERMQWQAQVDELEQRLLNLQSVGETWEYEKSQLVEAHSERIQQLENHILALQSEIDKMSAHSAEAVDGLVGTSSCVKRNESAREERPQASSFFHNETSLAEPPSEGDDEPISQLDHPANTSSHDDAAEILARYGFAVNPTQMTRNSPAESSGHEDEFAGRGGDSSSADGIQDTTESVEIEEAEDEEVREKAANHASFGSSTCNADDGGDNDDAITDYMQRLLQRVGSKKLKQSLPEAEMEKAAEAAPSAPKVSKPSPMPVASDSDATSEPPTMPPKRVKAEPATNLDAMRAIANANTRSAIQTHQVVKEKMKIFLNLCLTVIVVLLATTAMVLGRVKMPMLFYFGAASIPFALMFGWQTLRGVFRARSLKKTGGRKTPQLSHDEGNEAAVEEPSQAGRKSPNSEDFLGALRAPMND